MKAQVDFVILASPRTGSTYLVNALDTHPEIHCRGELFGYYIFRNFPYVKYLRFRHNAGESQIIRILKAAWNFIIRQLLVLFATYRDLNPHAYLEKWREKKPAARYFGFKLLPPYRAGFVILPFIPHKAGIALLPSLKPLKIIRLKRRNIVKQAISREMATLKRNWQARRPNIPQQKFILKPDRIAYWLDIIRKEEEMLDALVKQDEVSSITLVYEDFFSDIDSGLKAIADFFDINAADFNLDKVKIFKFTASDLRNVIVNYDEIYDSLASPQLKEMMADTAI